MVLLLAHVALGQIVFPEVEVVASRECGEGAVCLAREDCPAYEALVAQRREATGAQAPKLRARLVQELRDMVCNKQERKVCCPTGSCSCNGALHLDRGECGEASSSGCGNWCYVDPGNTCRDSRPSSFGAPHEWSCQACRSRDKEEILQGDFEEDTKQICVTDSGATAHQPCIFPFQFNGVLYNECTWTSAHLTEHKPWCSTFVDESGHHVGGQGKWGNCGPGCPIPPDDRLPPPKKDQTEDEGGDDGQQEL